MISLQRLHGERADQRAERDLHKRSWPGVPRPGRPLVSLVERGHRRRPGVIPGLTRALGMAPVSWPPYRQRLSEERIPAPMTDTSSSPLAGPHP